MGQTNQEESSQTVVQTPPVQPTPEQAPDISTSLEVTTTPPRSSSKFPIVIIIAVIFLLAGGILAYFLLQKPTSQEPTPVSQRDISIPSATPPNSAFDHYIGSQTITLRDVSGGTLTAIATRNITIGKATHVIQTKLSGPQEGSFYGVWIVRNDNFLSIGKLNEDQSGDYALSTNFTFNAASSPFKTFEDLHNTLVVTLESVDDKVMETKLFEGTFTQ